MKTIITTTNFSSTSLNAVNYAADMATMVSAGLTLVHICSLPNSVSEMLAPMFDLEKKVEEAEDELQRLKYAIERRTAGRLRVNTIVLVGDIVSEINSYCLSAKPYAVVMGADSLKTFEHFLFGGKGFAAMREFNWPLIIVPPEVHLDHVLKIALVCDCQRVVETIPLEEINHLVKDFHAQLHVLHVFREGNDFSYNGMEEEFEWLKEALKKNHPKYHFIDGNEIEKSISDFARENEIDLLIVTPKKYNVLQRLSRHGHSKNLVLRTQGPVIAIL